MIYLSRCRQWLYSLLTPIFVFIFLVGFGPSVAAQILPKPAPVLNLDLPQYKGLWKKPVPTKQFMIDYMEVYVHLYIKQFYQMNKIQDPIFDEKKIIEKFRKDIEGIPLNFIVHFAPNSSDVMRAQLDTIALNQYPKTTSQELYESIRSVELRVAELEREMALVKEFFRVVDIKSGSTPRPKIDFIGELAKIKKELSTFSGQLKKQAQIQTNAQAYSRPSEEQPRPSKATYWIAIAALAISLVSFFANTKTRNKEKK